MPKKQPQAPEPKSAELGDTREERNRHLRYAHEQYSGSSQDRFDARKGRHLPREKPQHKPGDYLPGTKMPWPPDTEFEAETQRSNRRRGR